MAIELVCSCGRVVRLDRPPVGDEGRCPDCDALLTIDNDRSIKATITDMPVSDAAPIAPAAGPPGAARKPLWELMARNQSQPEFDEPPGALTIEADSGAEAAPPVPGTAGPGSSAGAGPSTGRKGLWSVMQVPAAAGASERQGETSPVKNPGGPILIESVPTPGSPKSQSEIPVSNSTGPKSEISAALAFSPAETLVPTGGLTPRRSPELKSEIPNRKSEISDPPAPEPLAALVDIAEREGLLAAQSRAAGAQAGNSRRAFTAAVMGGLSIPLSGLALINAGWSRLPAMMLGSAAVLTGLIAAQEIQRSGGRKTGRRQAISGIVTGIIGSFLGPLVIAPLSKLRKGR